MAHSLGSALATRLTWQWIPFDARLATGFAQHGLVDFALIVPDSRCNPEEVCVDWAI